MGLITERNSVQILNIKNIRGMDWKEMEITMSWH